MAGFLISRMIWWNPRKCKIPRNHDRIGLRKVGGEAMSEDKPETFSVHVTQQDFGVIRASVSEIREEFNENLLDHNKVPIPSPQPGDMVFSYYTGSPGLVLENLEKNKSKVLWGEYSQFIKRM